MSEKIKAVFEPDLEKVLRGLGLWEGLQAGEMRCSICGGEVTLDNLQFIFPKGGKILVGCGKSSCVQEIERVTGDA